MSANVWKVVHNAGRALSAAPLFASFAAELPRGRSGPLQGLSDLLQTLQSGGIKVCSSPLRASTLLGLAAQMLDQYGEKPDAKTREAFAKWAGEAVRLGEVTYGTVAWLRSRLPGYPTILAPQLCPGSPLMEQGINGEVLWRTGERSRGRHKTNSPSGLNRALDITDGPDFEGEIVRLAEALKATSTWTRMQTAVNSLSEADKKQLSDCRTKLCALLSPDAVDAYEKNGLLRRSQYRRHMVEQELDSLQDVAKEYATAFAEADQLIERVAIDVLGQFAAYGDPLVLSDAAELQFCAGTPRTVAFCLNRFPPLNLCELVRLGDPLVPEILMVTSMTIRGDQAHGPSQRIVAEVLAGSSWPTEAS